MDQIALFGIGLGGIGFAVKQLAEVVYLWERRQREIHHAEQANKLFDRAIESAPLQGLAPQGMTFGTHIN